MSNNIRTVPNDPVIRISLSATKLRNLSFSSISIAIAYGNSTDGSSPLILQINFLFKIQVNYDLAIIKFESGILKLSQFHALLSLWV